MSNKKDIGKAYKEVLHEYKSTPHNRVWENIEMHLDEPKRRLFPFWKTVTGILILLLIPASIYTYQHYKNTDSNNANTTTFPLIEPNLNPTTHDINTSNDFKTRTESPLENNETGVTSATNNDTNTLSNSEKKTSTYTQDNTDEAITESQNKATKSQRGLSFSSQGLQTNTKNASYNAVISNQKQNKTSTSTNTNTSATTNANNTINAQITSGSNFEFDATKGAERFTLNGNPIVLFKTDGLTLFDKNLRFKETSKTKKVKNDAFTFHAKAYGGPTYFSSLKQGFAIDSRLADNTIEGGTNINYGAAIVFDLSERSNISFGIGLTKLNYTVKQADSTNFEGYLNNSPSFQNLSLSNNDNTILGNFSSIDLRQDIEYLEFPVTYSYKLIQKKIALSVHGGPSFLALIDNGITAKSTNGSSLMIGEANNLSKISLSLNIGLGLSYSISDRFSIYTEPVFKYHINTFNNNSTFKPYSLGLGFGIQYKF